jgi:thioredoxin 1
MYLYLGAAAMKKPVLFYGTIFAVAALLSLQCEALKHRQIVKDSEQADGSVRKVYDENFEQLVIKSSVPVFVDFWAPWCGPCKRMFPIVETLAGDYKGRVRFYKVDVDENKVVPEIYQAHSIPNFVIFKNGQIAARLVGTHRRDELRAAIDGVLGK